MEKVFEALKFIFGEALFSEYKDETHNRVRECNSIVYKALTELKDIKEAEPNDVINCLDYLDSTCGCFATDKEYEAVNTVKQYILKAQEQEKAFKIVVKKNVNTLLLKTSSTLEEYNNELVSVYGMWSFVKDRQLTEEEFEILKRTESR